MDTQTARNGHADPKTARNGRPKLTEAAALTADFYRSGYFSLVSLLVSPHVAKCEQDDYSFALKIILCIVSHWAVGAHDPANVESPITWPQKRRSRALMVP